MRMRIFSTTLIAAVVLFAACCPCRFSRKNAKPLVGTEWHLVQLQGKDVGYALDKFNVQFAADGSLAGIGACNRFTAPYSSTEKRALNIGTIASTRRYCPDQEVEQKMFKELDDAAFYEIDGPMLLLLKDGEIRAIFRAKDEASTTTQDKTN